MAQTVRESIAGALGALARGDFLVVKEELDYALFVLNAAERERLADPEDGGGRRLVYDWDDETIRDQLPGTLGEGSVHMILIVEDEGTAPIEVAKEIADGE